jgi:hypothetical protein
MMKMKMMQMKMKLKMKKKTAVTSVTPEPRGCSLRRSRAEPTDRQQVRDLNPDNEDTHSILLSLSLSLFNFIDKDLSSSFHYYIIARNDRRHWFVSFVSNKSFKISIINL